MAPHLPHTHGTPHSCGAPQSHFMYLNETLESFEDFEQIRNISISSNYICVK